MAVPATAPTASGCARPSRPRSENTRPRLDHCSAQRIRPDRRHRPRSRPVFGPPLRQLASDPSVPVEGGCANDYDYCSGDPVNCTDVSGRERFDVYDIDPDVYDPWFAFYFPGTAAEAYFRGTILAGRRGFERDPEISTPLGTRRPDWANFRSRVAYEVKSGNQGLNAHNLGQANKDYLLVQQGWRIEWHVYPGRSGRVPGLSRALVDYLDQRGINVIVHHYGRCRCY